MKPEEILVALTASFDDHKAEVAALQREVAHQTRTAEQWRLSYVEEKRRAEVAEAELAEARTVTDEMAQTAQGAFMEASENGDWQAGVRAALEAVLGKGA